jgi:hypothetical protein
LTQPFVLIEKKLKIWAGTKIRAVGSPTAQTAELQWEKAVMG